MKIGLLYQSQDNSIRLLDPYTGHYNTLKENCNNLPDNKIQIVEVINMDDPIKATLKPLYCYTFEVPAYQFIDHLDKNPKVIGEFIQLIEKDLENKKRSARK